MKMRTWVSAVALILTGGAVLAQDHLVAEATATLQTPVLTEADNDADADDPAIWVTAADPAASDSFDAVQESDGTDVMTVPLPGFPAGHHPRSAMPVT